MKTGTIRKRPEFFVHGFHAKYIELAVLATVVIMVVVLASSFLFKMITH